MLDSIVKEGSLKGKKLNTLEEIKDRFKNIKKSQFKRLAKLKHASIVNTTPTSPYQFSEKNPIPNNNESKIESEK